MPREFHTDVDLMGALLLNGSAGTSGQIPRSAGPGAAPTWGAGIVGSGTTGLRNITTSTSDPTGGSDGDIWIKYTP